MSKMLNVEPEAFSLLFKLCLLTLLLLSMLYFMFVTKIDNFKIDEGWNAIKECMGHVEGIK